MHHLALTAAEAEALDLVVLRTGHGRYRRLCDPDHPDHHPDCPALMLRMAAEFRGVPAPGPAPPARRRTRYDVLSELAATCSTYCRLPSPCGCSAPTCLAGRSGNRWGGVTLADCVRCLLGPPDAGPDPTPETPR